MRMALSGRHARCLPVLEAVSSRLKLHDAPRALLVQDAVAALSAPDDVARLDGVLRATVSAQICNPCRLRILHRRWIIHRMPSAAGQRLCLLLVLTCCVQGAVGGL